MVDKNIKEGLKLLLKGEVTDDEQSLKAFSKDASIFELRPQIIVAPQDTLDIQKLVGFINSQPPGLSVTARSAGTDMSGGAINDSIILDMTKHFNQIKKVGENFALTQPGVYYRDFEASTLKRGLLLPCYPASRELCTVGGMVANNSAGEKTLSYGQTQNFVQSLKVILADGNEYKLESISKNDLNKKLAQKNFEGQLYRKIYQLIEKNFLLIRKAKPKVHKNSSGYLLWEVWNRQTFDLSKLIVGSQGTLGIISEIKFKLIKPKKHSKLLVIFLKNLDGLDQIVNRILTHHPESFESFDDYTLKVAMRFLPEVLKIMNAKNAFSLFLQFLPEVWMSLSGGVPKLVLIAEFTADTSREADSLCKKAQQDLSRFHLQSRITKGEQEAKKYWTLRRESFNLLRHHAGRLRTAPFIDDLIVRPENLSMFLPRLQKILNQYQLIYTIAGHIGDGNFHIIPLMDFTDPRTKQIIPELSQKVYNLVFAFNGSMTAEHNDGLIRGPYLEKMYGPEVYQLFKEVKNIFDPKNIFNPHKKVDATSEYSFSHLSPD